MRATRITAPATVTMTILIGLLLTSGCGDGLRGMFGIHPVVTLTSPNGGEEWVAGETRAVTWTTQSVSGDVEIRHSTDGGATFPYVVATVAANTGSYSWTVPGEDSLSCRLEVVQVGGAGARDESDADFRMAPPHLVLTSPNGGETFYYDAVGQEIAWTSYGVLGNVDIHYSTNGGAVWFPVSLDAPNTGSYAWTVPNVASSLCRVRIRSAGDLDIVAGNAGAQPNRVWTNDGAGQFTDSGQTLIAGNTRAVAVGDVDGDGDLDIINGSIGASKLWINDGVGAFTDSGQALGTSESWAAAVGDVDGDGDIDIVAGNISNQANRVWINDGTGIFTDSGQALGAGWTYAAALGDMDSDGDLDIVSVNYFSEENRVYRNNSAVANTPPSAPGGLGAIVSGTGPYDVTFSWSAANDAETPQASLTYNLRVGTSASAADIFAGHADATGWREVPALGNVQHNTSWTLTLPAGTYYWSVQAVDTASAGSAWATEKTVTAAPPVTFTDIGAAVVGVSQGSLAWGDYDSDGDLDLAIAGLDPGSIIRTRIYQNNAGVFTDIVAGLAQVYNASLAWGDYDGDGDLDLALAGWNGSVGVSKIYRNDGGGTFTDTSAALTGVGYAAAAWGDFDNDDHHCRLA